MTRQPDPPIRLRIAVLVSLLIAAPAAAQESPGENWRDPVEAPEPEPEPAVVNGAALLEAIPDIALRPWPPPTDISILFGGHTRFQLVGGGVGISGFPVNWLRLSAFYGAGVALDLEGSFFSSYAEGIVSFKLFGVDSGSMKDVYDKEAGFFTRPRPKLVLTARLPSHHGFLAEGGVFTGTVALQRCVANCELESEVLAQRKRQLVYPFAGLRYIFYTEARSKKRPLVERVAEVHAFGHVIARPLNDWRPAGYYGRRQVNEPQNLGFRVGTVLPVCRTPGCFGAGISLGVLPSPRALMLDLSIGG